MWPQFTNTMLLWLLPLAAIPIILHMITRLRLRTIELSTFRFLMDSYVQQRRRLRLLEFFLMMLRAAFVVLIVAAMARPMVDRFGFLFGGKASEEVAIIVDAGPSMALRSGGTTSIERAAGVARHLVGLLGPDSSVTLIRAADQPEVVINRFASQPGPILERIDAIETGASSSDMAAALEQVFDTKRTAPRTVYVLTDANRAAWTGVQNHPLLRRIDASSRVVIIDVGPTESIANLSVVGDPPPNLRPIVGLPVLLSATVVNRSQESAQTVLSVTLDGKQVQSVNLTLDPGQQVTRPIVITPTRAGVLRGRYELPGDAFTDDDDYIFSLQVKPHVSVLLVSPKGGEARERPDLYLRAALESPLTASEDFSEQERRLAQAVRITTVLPDQLKEPMITQSDVVILANVAVDAARGAMLRAYVKSGGGLLLLPGSRVESKAYLDHLLGPMNAPLTLGTPVGDPDDESTFTTLTAIDYAHPVLGAFADRSSEYFSTVRVYRHFPLSLIDDSDEGADASRPRVLMRLADGSPFLVETPVADGLLLTAAAGATPDWSNLPLKPEFVPILLRAVAHLQRRALAHVPSTVEPDRPAPIQLMGSWPDAQVQVTDPTQTPHVIEMHRSGQRIVGAMFHTHAKGYYAVNVLPRAEDAPQRIELGFAVNLDPRHTDLTALDESELRAMFQPHDLTYLGSARGDPLLVEQLGRKQSLWRHFIGLTFVVILMEFLLATPRARQGADDEPTDRGAALQRWGRRIGGMMNQTGMWVNLPTAPRSNRRRVGSNGPRQGKTRHEQHHSSKQ